MKISKYFTVEEFVASQTATRKGIDNTPTQEILDTIKKTAAKLDVVRELLGHPVLISSGFRCPQLNKAIGGAKSSSHMTGYAVDFTCPGFGTPQQAFDAIRKSPIRFDQCIAEGTWCHISFDPRTRCECLNAKFVGGKAIYTEVE